MSNEKKNYLLLKSELTLQIWTDLMCSLTYSTNSHLLIFLVNLPLARADKKWDMVESRQFGQDKLRAI